MASREIRRITKKSKEDQANQKSYMEKRRDKHPLLYAGSVVLFAIIAISFVGSGLFGSNSFLGMSRQSYGKYAGESIYIDQYNFFGRTYSRIGSQAQDSSAGTLKRILKDSYMETARHKAVLNKAEASGYHVTEKAVNKALLKHSRYLDEEGNFDEKRYQDVDNRYRDATRAYTKEILVDQQYRTDALYSHYFNQKEMEFFRSMVSLERSFKFVDFPLDNYPDEKVAEYGGEHLADFRQIRLSRIILGDSNQADANQILDKFTSGQSSFEDLAKLYSRGPYGANGGDMGVQYYYQVRGYFEELEFPDDMAAEIFRLSENTASGVIQVGDTWHIYRVNSAAKEADLEDEETISAIRDYILSQMRGEVVDYIEEQALAFKTEAEGSSFEDAAVSFQLGAVAETEFFPLNYLSFYVGKNITVKGDDTGRLSGAKDNESFYEVAFGLKEGEVSEPVRLDEKLVVLQLMEERVLDDTGWALADGYYRNLVQYQPPVFAELIGDDPESYIYLFTANQYFSEEFQDDIIEPELFDDNFETAYARYNSQ